jgi:hypothetical protein
MGMGIGARRWCWTELILFFNITKTDKNEKVNLFERFNGICVAACVDDFPLDNLAVNTVVINFLSIFVNMRDYSYDICMFRYALHSWPNYF